MNGGSWIEQETLLLLEDVEFYGDNCNEIGEHVDRKSNAQCILHFIRIPIDIYVDSINTNHASLSRSFFLLI